MNILNLAGIYRFTNIVTGDFYIGSAISLRRRRAQHLTSLRKGTHFNQHFQNSFARYGDDAFVFDVLLICSKCHLLEYEQRCMDGLKPTFNVCVIAGSNLGLRVTEQARALLSKSLKAYFEDPAAREHIASKKRGIKQSEHTISKRIAQTKGQKRTVEQCERIAKSMIGRRVSEEHKAALRKGWEGRRGRPISLETKAKLSAASLKRWSTVGSRDKVHRGPKHTPESKAKISAARKLYWKNKKSGVFQ